jgi:membrane peptidoglycan carboxypeptidase
MIDTAYRMGIKTELEEVASLPLGTNELNIIEITNAYATLASGGIKHEPFFISKVTDMNDNILYEHKDTSEIVLNYDNVYILNNLLSLTYDYDMIDYAYPTNISINALLSNKYAIKSGSTNTDNWVIGFNKNVVTSVWVGYDDNSDLVGNDYKYVKKIWANSMEKYLKDKDNTWYEKPNNVVGVFVNPITGELADEKTKKRKIFYFVEGTEPTDIQSVFKEIDEEKDYPQ